MKYVELDRLRGGKVYDAYGLYYGYICGYEVEENIVLRICVDVDYEKLIPDIEKLKNMLRERGVDAEESTLEELVATARRLGLDIPFKSVREPLVMVKAIVSVDEVAVVDVTEDEEVIIVLREPRQARYRGLTAEPRPSLRHAVGKTVVSFTKGYLGKIVAIAIGPGRVALKAVRYGLKFLSWPHYISSLRAQGLTDLASKLVEEIGDPLVTRRLPVSQLKRVEEALERLRAPRVAFELLAKSVQAEEEHATIIDWERVKYTGDIVVTE